MKRFIIAFLVATLCFSIVSAQQMREMDWTFNLENDNTISVVIYAKFSEEIKKINIPISGTISNLETENGKCQVVVTVQQILQCEPPSPFFVGDWSITTKFKLTDLIKKQGNISQFNFDVPVLWLTKQMSVTLRLPVGYTVSENFVLPLSPAGAFVLLEGRRATIRWNFENIREGNIIPVRVNYESIGPISTIFESVDPLILVIIIVLLVVVVGISAMIYVRVSKKRKVVLSILNENERMVVNIIQSQQEEKVDQRRIVEQTGFSKAKVSRIIKSLEERGVVDTERIGRKNRVRLKKKLLEE